MSNEPLVSVHMITYNHESYIAQAIEGVLAQKTTFPFELVIGEDCSTDGTRRVALEYQRKHPQIIHLLPSEKNLGLMVNAYRTDKACRGKYIAYCEGDDFWQRTDKLQLQVDFLESHPEVGLVHSDYDRLFQDTGLLMHDFTKSEGNAPPADLDFYKILHGGKWIWILLCTVMVRRELMWNVLDSDPELYQTRRFMTGDTARWAEMSLLARTAYIDQSLATNRLLPESVSRTNDPRKQMAYGRNNRELFMYLIDKHGLSSDERRIHEKYWCDYSLVLAAHDGDKALADKAKSLLPSLTIRQRIFYLSTRNRLVHIVFKAVWSFFLALKGMQQLRAR